MAWWDKKIQEVEDRKDQEIADLKRSFLERGPEMKNKLAQIKEELQAMPQEAEFPESEQEREYQREETQIDSNLEAIKDNISILKTLSELRSLWRRLQKLEIYIKQDKVPMELKDDGKGNKYLYVSEVIDEAEFIKVRIKEIKDLIIYRSPRNAEEDTVKELTKIQIDALKGKDGYEFVTGPR